MTFFHKLLFFISFLFLINTTHSQTLKHEVGGIIGSTMFQGDYGQRSNFGSSIANVGFGIGAVYYLSFSEGRGNWYQSSSYMKNHFRFRGEFSYMSTKFRHHGDVSNIKMLAMEGSTKMVNIGGQVEFTIFSNEDDRVWKPFLSTGIFHTNYNPDLKSDLGDWRNDPSLLPAAYLNDGIYLKKDKTQAFVFGGGTRYELKNFDLVFEMRWQRFLNGTVDGIDPKLSANKYRDWLAFINIGAVFQLN